MYVVVNKSEFIIHHFHLLGDDFFSAVTAHKAEANRKKNFSLNISNKGDILN